MSATKNLLINLMNSKPAPRAFNFKQGWKHYQTNKDIFLRLDVMLDQMLLDNGLFIKKYQ